MYLLHIGRRAAALLLVIWFGMVQVSFCLLDSFKPQCLSYLSVPYSVHQMVTSPDSRSCPAPHQMIPNPVTRGSQAVLLLALGLPDARAVLSAEFTFTGLQAREMDGSCKVELNFRSEKDKNTSAPQQTCGCTSSHLPMKVGLTGIRHSAIFCTFSVTQRRKIILQPTLYVTTSVNRPCRLFTYLSRTRRK